MSPEAIDALVKAGCTGEQIAAAVLADQMAARARRHRPNDERVWVYVIAVDHPDDDLIKVGISQHPNHRLQTLERERGYNLYLAHTEGPYARADALEIERRAHQLLAELRETGEWFVCGARWAIEVVSSCAKAAT